MFLLVNGELSILIDRAHWPLQCSIVFLRLAQTVAFDFHLEHYRMEYFREGAETDETRIYMKLRSFMRNSICDCQVSFFFSTSFLWWSWALQAISIRILFPLPSATGLIRIVELNFFPTHLKNLSLSENCFFIPLNTILAYRWSNEWTMLKCLCLWMALKNTQLVWLLLFAISTYLYSLFG